MSKRPVSGRGISAAVRHSIPHWLDASTKEAIKKKAGMKTDISKIQEAHDWVRDKRTTTGIGWRRTFKCITVSDKHKLELEIQTNKRDNEIQYYAFKVDGVFVAGGDCRVLSAKTPGHAGKSQHKISGQEGTLVRRLNDEDLRKLNTQTEFGDGFDRLFEPRE